MSTTFNFNGTTALVTGAAGFIGSHLMAALKARGVKVIGIDHKSGTDIIPADVTDPDSLAQGFKSRVDYIFHLAGQKSAGLCKENPGESLTMAFNSTLHILELAKKHSVKKTVLISSMAVYGTEETGDTSLLQEKSHTVNDSIYTGTKLITETLGISYAKDFKLPVTVARLANVYGPGQSPMAVIPSLIQQMKTSSSISMGNTEPVKDFIFVSDVVEALIAIAITPSTSGKVLNVSTAEGTSVKTILELLKEKLHFKGAVTVDPAKVRANERKKMVADHSELTNLTGWNPKVKIKDGVELCLK